MSVLNTMFSILEAMLREHEQLLATAKRKKEVLIKNDMDALGEITKEEVVSAHRLERLEAERLASCRLLAVRLQVPPEQVTASQLLSMTANPEEAVRMKGLTDRLREIYDELKQLNDLNKLLIQQSLQFVTTSIELLSESPHVPTYGGTGQTTANNPYQAGGRTSFFDSKA